MCLAEYQNIFFRVQIIQETTSINCTYLDSRNETNLSCNATIFFGDNCENHMDLTGIKESDKLISINLIILQETMTSEYCDFIVTARAGTRLLYVEGDLSK